MQKIKKPISKSYRLSRRRWDSNPRIKVLQTFALDHLATSPLKNIYMNKYKKIHLKKWIYKRAGDGTRTRDINLGKVALYQLSYSRLYFRQKF